MATRAGYNGLKLTQSRRTAISLFLEQVDVRGFNCRGVRLERFAVLGMALAMSALAAMPALAAAGSQATQTRLTAETRDQNGRTQAAMSISVTGEDGRPAISPGDVGGPSRLGRSRPRTHRR